MDADNAAKTRTTTGCTSRTSDQVAVAGALEQGASSNHGSFQGTEEEAMSTPWLQTLDASSEAPTSSSPFDPRATTHS